MTRTFEVLALPDGYFQVMKNSQDGRYWVPIASEWTTLEKATAEADRLEKIVLDNREKQE